MTESFRHFLFCMHEQLKNEKEKGKWILVIGCNCLVFEMGNGAFAGQMDLNANVHCFSLHFNFKPASHSHSPLVWTGKIISHFLSLEEITLSLKKREREWHRKTTCAQGIYNSYMSWSISQAIFNFSSLHTYACMNEWTIFLSHTLTYIFNTF